jgi:hypothetical protein
MSKAESARAAAIDTLNHSSVQPWSAGPFFPCILGTIERYADLGADNAIVPLNDRLLSVSYSLHLDGRTEEYASAQDAEMVAAALLASPALRARWSKRDAMPIGKCMQAMQS